MPRVERPLGGEDSALVQFAGDLRLLRDKAGKPSYRELARRAHYASTTLSDAAGGRRLPTLAVVLAYVSACDGDVVEWEQRWREVAAARGEEDGTAPYSGLAALQVEDADRLFGRTALLEEIVGRLTQNRFLAVVGASGVGKSSLLRAGLVARVRTEGLGDSAAATAVVMTPGERPVDELAARLAERAGDRELVVVIDQFEEVFTLCHDREERARFVAAVVAAAGGRTRVVIGMRADFFAHCADYPELRAVMGGSQVLVGAMTTDELRQVVVGPAERMACTVENSLVAAVVADAAGQAAVLPLVSHALLETWRRRKGGTLTLAGYRAAGGIEGALAKTAEDLYGSLSPERKRLTRELFLRLTVFGEGTGDTKRRVLRDELDTGDPDTWTVLESLASARLVTLDEATAELTHEAVITAWARLHNWLVTDRDGLRTHRRLTEAAYTWKALGQDTSALYRGTQLVIAREWAERDGHREELNPAEQAFLDASIELEASERKRTRRRDRQLRYLTVGLVVLLVVVIGIALVAVQQRRDAVDARQVAISRQLATQAQTLVDSRPDTAMLLSVQAYRTAPTVEARSALLGMSTRGAYQAEFAAHAKAVSELAFSSDGRTLVTASADHSMATWDVRARHRIASLTEHDTWLRALATSPDGSTMASGGDDKDIILWHLASNVRVGTLSGHTAAVKEVAFSPNGRLLASGGADDTVIIWDLAQRTAIARFTGHGGTVNSLAFSADGRVLAAAGTGKTVVLWDIATQTRIKTLAGHTDTIYKVAFDRTGRYLASAGDTTVRLWNAADGSPSKVLTGHIDRVLTLAFSPDGTTLASAGNDTKVLLWDVGRGVLRTRLTGHTNSVYALAFGADSLLASAGETGSVILWNTDQAILVETGENRINDLAFSPDGTTLAEAAENRTMLWDAKTRRQLGVLTDASTVNALAFSPNGKLLATANKDGTITLWALENGTQIAKLTGHTDAALDIAFSPSGHTLVTSGIDKTAIVWDVATHVRMATLSSHTGAVNGVTFSSDGQILATASHDFTVVLWNTADWTPRVQLIGHKGWVRNATFSPDGRTVATASSDSTVRLWDAATGTLKATLTGHLDTEFNGVAFSPDSTTLAFTSGENTISLWNLDKHTNWARLAGHTKAIRALAFSPDGRTLVTAGGEMVLFWDTDAERAARQICDTFWRDLTDDEWNQLVADLPRQNTC
ncbi:WD40 repeat protein/energy-coupling factor transporter ATP-binding protein EcfA2 [Kibdelosporangium banguiense]|uniref:WD40 repeat protein/energy-coupling factor transporter ATP-binding protein EcfA2 n=1 Tax=Kibdelosporangium banguiense TaxID=1365924 RepID=A0ABS4TU56_9PSEU|nr:PD40 domain-containing protein [Kibdelosporangium banguiense]MBP2327930.1 WD40 repeat protein/energy-coupling factor transporter ATP-binding protein EcfA2 [Kibdelosporangium banguiense]